jgi:hypothetical protein
MENANLLWGEFGILQTHRSIEAPPAQVIDVKAEPSARSAR